MPLRIPGRVNADDFNNLAEAITSLVSRYGTGVVTLGVNTYEGDFTVPAGVTLRGVGDASLIVGTITLEGEKCGLVDVKVDQVADAGTPIVVVSSPAAYLQGVTAQLDSATECAVQVIGGGFVEWNFGKVVDTTPGSSGYAFRIDAGGMRIDGVDVKDCRVARIERNCALHVQRLVATGPGGDSFLLKNGATLRVLDSAFIDYPQMINHSDGGSETAVDVELLGVDWFGRAAATAEVINIKAGSLRMARCNFYMADAGTDAVLLPNRLTALEVVSCFFERPGTRAINAPKGAVLCRVDGNTVTEPNQSGGSINEAMLLGGAAGDGIDGGVFVGNQMLSTTNAPKRVAKFINLTGTNCAVALNVSKGASTSPAFTVTGAGHANVNNVSI